MANHYIREGGSGDGSDWTNAWDDLPSSLTRGNTYYIADGAYSPYTVDDADSGTLWIYIKKAIAADHGTETGWDSAYGDGVATFTSTSITNPLRIDSNYIHVDGQVGSYFSGHGFRFLATDTTTDVKTIQVMAGQHDILIEHSDIESSGYSTDRSSDNIYLYDSSGTTYIYNVTFRHCWIHNTNRVHFYVHSVRDLVVEYCALSERYNEDTFGVHGESFTIYTHGNHAWKNSMGMVIRYNKFRNNEGTGLVVFQNIGVALDQGGCDFYGNIIYGDSDHVLDGHVAGTAPSLSDFDLAQGSLTDTGTGWVCSNVNCFNNTFVDQAGEVGVTIANPGYSAIVVRNNLWSNCGTPSVIANTESNNTTDGATSLFDDYANHDYHLASDTADGYTLAAPYNEDMDGVTRVGFNPGAYEFTTGESMTFKTGIALRF